MRFENRLQHGQGKELETAYMVEKKCKSIDKGNQQLNF
jgi:hypothetical protein